MAIVPDRSSEELRNELRAVINRWNKEGHPLTTSEVIGVLEMLKWEIIMQMLGKEDGP